MRLTPAKHVVKQFSGIRQTAKALGRTRATVWKWTKLEYIPAAMHKKILELAGERSLDITPSDLILGREMSDEQE